MSKQTLGRIWITKYALSDGVLPLDGAHEVDGGYISKTGPFTGEWGARNHFYGGKDWHLTSEAANTRAEEMRIAKIASLEKQITKLKKLKFSDPRS